MSPYLQNLLTYLAVAAVAAALAGGAALAGQLSGTDPINWRPVAAAALSAVITALGSMALPRLGHERVAELVDQIGQPDAKRVLANEAAAQERIAQRGY